MVLVYTAFAFAFRITMIPATRWDSHVPDLTGDLMMNYDIAAEIIGARSIIDGSFDMYVGRYSKKAFPPEGVAISYPPLTAYLQVPIVYAGMQLGLDPLGMTMLMVCGLVYIILGALCALQAGVVLKKSLNVQDEMTVTATVFLLLFSSLTFWVVTYSARFEFVVALFLLLAMSALASERYGRAGAFLGLALMTKQLALPATVVFVAAILLGTMKKEIAPRKALRFLTALPVPFVILIPFWIASPHDLWVGLFGTPTTVTIMKVSFINAVLQMGKWIFEEEALRHFLRLHSNLIISGSCIGFVLFIIIKKGARLGTTRFCALVALASFFFPVLAKYTNITRYAAVASIFVVLWGASRKPGFPYDALWFVVLQSFILDHVPAIWKQYVGLTFYAVVSVYVYYLTFSAGDRYSPAHNSGQSEEERGPT
jgi:hypothetical protein